MLVAISKRMEDAPNYGPAKNPTTTCGNCVHGGDGYCDLYKFNYKSGYWCSSWEAMTKQYDKHTPPSEVMHNAQRGQKLYQHLPPEHQTMDTTKYEIMSGLAVGRPMGKDELDAIDSHHQEFPQHPDKHVHLGMGGRAGRSWVKRLKRMYGSTEKAVGAEPPHRVNGYTYPVDTAAGATSASKAKPKCPHCGSSNYVLMPTDFETAKCKDCGKNWNHGIVPGINDPYGTSKSIDLYGDISKRDDEQQIVFGFASVVQENGKTVVDQQGDIVTPQELEKMAYDYVLNCRVGGEMHERKGVGKLCESMVFTPQKMKALGIDEFNKVAWWIGMKITDPKVWAKVKDGTYKSFSIHGSGKRDKLDDGEISVAEIQRQ